MPRKRKAPVTRPRGGVKTNTLYGPQFGRKDPARVEAGKKAAETRKRNKAAQASPISEAKAHEIHTSTERKRRAGKISEPQAKAIHAETARREQPKRGRKKASTVPARKPVPSGGLTAAKKKAQASLKREYAAKRKDIRAFYKDQVAFYEAQGNTVAVNVMHMRKRDKLKQLQEEETAKRAAIEGAK